MNGAVQGVATTTASRPVKNAARFSPPLPPAPPRPIKRVPISNTPAKFKPMATMPSPSAKFTQGDCS